MSAKKNLIVRCKQQQHFDGDNRTSTNVFQCKTRNLEWEGSSVSMFRIMERASDVLVEGCIPATNNRVEWLSRSLEGQSITRRRFKEWAKTTIECVRGPGKSRNRK